MEIAKDMYREELLEHSKNPLNRGKIGNADASHHDFNSMCGDEIEIFIKINEEKVEDVKFSGTGCAISQAAASILTEHIKGMKLKEILAMHSDEVLGLIPFKMSYLRMKCGLLAMKAIQRAIVKRESVMKTKPSPFPKQKNKK